MSDAKPRVSFAEIGGERIAVLSFPSPRLRYPDGATEAERQIVDLLVDGFSAAEIAERRQASPRTVARQLADLFGKAGVNSQAELIAKLLEAPRGRDHGDGD